MNLRTLLAGSLCIFLAVSPAAAERRARANPRIAFDSRDGRILTEQALRKFWEARLPRSATAAAGRALNADVGHVAVLQDDGTLFFPASLFDLDNRSLSFVRNSDGSYVVSAGNTPVDMETASAGERIPLTDDDTRSVTFGFNFPFYDKTYTAVFLNSDGNLTFNAGDIDTSERDLGRFLLGEPRIAPFFSDLEPSLSNRGVTVNKQPDRVVFSWVTVPLCCDSLQPRQTFQATLFADGRILFSYSGIESRAAVVGLSPGAVTQTPALQDFSQIDNARLSGAIAQVFQEESLLCETCVIQRFYSTHDDAYDQVVIFANFDFITDAFAYAVLVKNQIRGINRPLGDASSFYGSAGRLSTYVAMNNIDIYPDDPRQRILGLGENSTVSVLGQELGHRWLAFLRYPDDFSPTSTILLGRDNAHWSFFFNSEASVMEGNEIRDNGDGTFTTTAAVNKYSSFDQYVMGLRAPEEVPASFVVADPLTSIRPSSAPRIGAAFPGRRVAVTIENVIQANGARLPPAVLEQKDYNFAFVLVVRRGTSATQAQLDRMERIRSEWEQFWSQATSNRSKGTATLVKSARLIPLPAVAGSGATINGTLTLQSPAPAGGVMFQLASSDGNVAAVPANLTVPAGARTAPVVINARAAGTATITATAAGYLPISGAVQVTTSGAVVNGASFGAGMPASSGAIVSLFAPGLATTTAAAQALPLPTTLGGATVTVAGTRVPLFFVSPNQINAHVPHTLRGAYLPVVIDNGSGQTTTLAMTLERASPGLFTLDQSGAGPAAVLHASTGALVSASAPARPGEFLSIFATGLGSVNPAPAVGEAASSSPLSVTTEVPQVTIGGVAATVSFSGLAPGFVGLYQINVQVPASVTGPAVPLVVTASGVPSNTATLAVQ